jgi:hypothetical protein
MGPGSYSARLGLYRREQGRRIPLLDGAEYVEFFRCEWGDSKPPDIACGLTESD